MNPTTMSEEIAPEAGLASDSSKLTLLVQNQIWNFPAAQTPLLQPEGKLIARFPGESKPPSALPLIHHSHSAKFNSFRGFGINE